VVGETGAAVVQRYLFDVYEIGSIPLARGVGVHNAISCEEVCRWASMRIYLVMSYDF